jgi:hypothetical protein
LYAGKIVTDPLTHQPAFLAFHHNTPTGEFIGTLSDPVPVTVHPNGELELRP